jgi:hypothetical protein
MTRIAWNVSMATQRYVIQLCDCMLENSNTSQKLDRKHQHRFETRRKTLILVQILPENTNTGRKLPENTSSVEIRKKTPILVESC